MVTRDFGSLGRNRKLYIFFYLQPIDSNYYCTFIHLSPASNGKVDESHLNKLYFKKEKMKNHHITILGNAFDADNKYDSLDCKAF